MRLSLKLIGSAASSAVAVAVLPAASVAAPPPAMTVAVHPASGVSSSYFTLSASPGRFTGAGTLELRNRRRHSITVRLDPVGAITASTLGSAYRAANGSVSDQARWIALPRRRITLAPRGVATIPVGVRLPEGAAAGDYLSGISVEALGQARPAEVHAGVAIA